jgi:RHS repeat-associated protein
MRRLGFVVLALGLLTSATVTARAQVVRPPSGGVTTMMQGGGGSTFTPWTLWSDPSGPWPTTMDQYPLIRFYWCDDDSLDPTTRWIKVNGVLRTSSFDYSTEDPSGSCAARASSQTTSVALNVGSNLVEMYICDDDEMGPYCWYAMQYVTRLAGPVPVVSLAPYSGAVQDMARCAFDCFAATYAQSTVPYYSMDTPRNVTLVYHGDRVDPRSFVHVDVTHGGDASNLPTAYRLKVKRGQTNVTFLNGETTLRFTPSASTLRLGGQFDAAANGMSADSVYNITIVVGAEYAVGVEEVWATTTLIVVNENDSPIARGWTLAGVQRLYPTSGGALLTDGSGSAVYFTGSGTTYYAPAGEFTKLSASGTGTSRTFTRAYPDSTKLTFNYLGRMTEIRDRFNNATSFGYDGSNRLSQITDPAGKVTYLTYGTYGLSSVGGFGPVTNVSVNATRLLTAIRDPDNDSTRFAYDGTQRLSTITDRMGAATTLGYSPTSRKLTSVTAPSVTIYTGAQVQPVTTMAAWQSVGVPTGSTSGTPFSSARADTVRAGVTDPGGHAERFTVNAFGQPLRTTGPLGDTVTVTYNTAGEPLTVTDRLGVNSGYTYDGTGFLTSATVGGLTANYHNAGWGLADSIWGGAVSRQRLGIGANGRVNWTRLDDSSQTSFVYDDRGRVTSVTGPFGDMKVMHWYSGPLGNLAKDSIPGGRATAYGEDALGRDTLVQFPAHPPRTTTYDALNRPTQVWDGVNADSTHFGYDQLRLRTVTDPRGQVWSYNYNALGWLTSRVDPVGRRDSFAYDVEGLLRRVINRRGQATEMTYDSLHRQLTRTGAAITSDTVSYSTNGRVITASSGVAGQVTYLNGRLQVDSARTVFRAPGDPSRVYWRRYWYQAANGLLDSVTATAPGTTLLSRAYAYRPTRGTLDSLRLGSGAWTRLHVNQELAVDTVRFPGGWALAMGYVTADDLDQLSSPLMDLRYNRDTRGRIAQAQNRILNTMRAFQYDSLGQLRRVTFGVPIYSACEDPADFGPSCDFYTDSTNLFEYDQVGNRTLKATPGNNRVGAYGVGNRIQSFGECTYGTDDEGNVAWRSCPGQYVTFSWSADGLLTGYSISGGATVTFAYDAAGRVVRRDVNGVPASYFLWNGGTLLAELNGGHDVAAQYSYYPGLDRLHAGTWSGPVTYAQSDAEGNVRFLGTHWLNQIRSYSYDESGNLVGGGDYAGLNGIDRARWKGALYLAPEVGLYYMRSRWYEPRTGRFISEDPAGLAEGLNPYVFAGNDGINGSDPTGLGVCRDDESGHWDNPVTEVGHKDDLGLDVVGDQSWHDCDRERYEDRMRRDRERRQLPQGTLCDAYGQGIMDRTVRRICERLTGEDAPPENNCTGSCLARMHSDREYALGRSLNTWKSLGYLWNDHLGPLGCYRQCGYTKTRFAYDLIVRYPRPNEQPWLRDNWPSVARWGILQAIDNVVWEE